MAASTETCNVHITPFTEGSHISECMVSKNLNKHTNASKKMFTETQIVTVKSWEKKSRCPAIGDVVKRMMVQSYNEILYGFL